MAKVKYSGMSSSRMDMTLAYMSFGSSSSQMALPQLLLILRPSVPVRKLKDITKVSLLRICFCKLRPACMLKV